MPFTPIYSFPYEALVDQPGVTLHGGLAGTNQILAEEVERELVRVDNDVAEVAADLASEIAGLTVKVLGSADIAGTSTAPAFTGIDQTFEHLMLIWRGNHASGVNEFNSLSMRFNSDGGTDQYASQRISFGTSSSTFTDELVISDWQLSTSIRCGLIGNVLSNGGTIWIPRYTDAVAGLTGAYGTGWARRSSGGTTFTAGGYYVGTGPVTSIAIWPASTTWSNGRVTLVGFRP